MKNRVLFIIMFLGFGGGVLGQNPLVKQWDKRFGGTYNDYLISCQPTFDYGFLIGGYSQSGIGADKSQATKGGNDFWVIRIDSIGNKIWDKDFGGDREEYFQMGIQTNDSGFILSGASKSGSNGDKTQPNRDTTKNTFDFWIIKIDSTGNKLWDKRYGGSSDDYYCIVQQTKDNGYILGGGSNSEIGGDKSQNPWGNKYLNGPDSVYYIDYWIVKTDSLGHKLWDYRYGGTRSEVITSIQQTLDGGFIFGGLCWSGLGGDKTQDNWDTSLTTFDYWVIKTDSIGNKLWDKRFGGTNDDWLYSLQQTLDGGYILGGWSNSSISGDKTQDTVGARDYWIVKIDSLGNKQWDRDFGGTSYDELSSVIQTKDKGYILSGDSYSPIGGDKSESNLGPEQTWILKLDSLGNKIWDKTILTPGHDEYGFVVPTNDSCLVIANFFCCFGAGGYRTQSNVGEWDYWIVKFCDTTQLQPSINLSSSDTDFCEKHCINFFDLSTNNPTSWQWFFPGSDSTTSTLQNPTNICYNSYGSYDVTLIACNAAGCDTLHITNFITCYQNPTDSIYQSNDTLFSLPAYSYQWYEVTNGLIAGAVNQYFIPQQAGNFYCVATDSIGCAGSSGTIVITGITPLSLGEGQGVRCVPNPFNSTITITFQNKNIKKTSLTIKNVLGQNVFSTICSPLGVKGSSTINNPIEIDLSFLPQGIYLLDVMMDDTRCVRKIVKN